MVMQKADFGLISNYLDALIIPAELRQLISLEEFSQKNPDYYMRYPRLFRSVFGQQDDEQIDLLCIAGFLYYRSILFMDAMLDGKIKQDAQSAAMIPVAISVCQEETIKILTHIFGMRSNFWNYWNLRRKEYLQAYQLEKKLSKDPSCFSLELYESIAEKKAAIGKVAIDALFVLNHENEPQAYQALLAGHELFSIGLQLNDDFQDFEEDAASHQFNWAIFHTKNLIPPTVDADDKIDTPTLKKMMYIKGIAKDTLNASLHYFDKALHQLQVFSVAPEFGDILEEKKQETQNVIQQIKEYFCILNARIELGQIQKNKYEPFELQTPAIEPADQLINMAFHYLIAQANTDFSELKHLMYLGTGEGFNNETEIHVGDVFQRAILLDMLCDLRDKTGHKNLLPLIDDEVNYLKDQQLKIGLGGWSYFPSVKEIAPDADDLGQILQGFARTNQSDVIQHDGVSLLDTLFSDNYLETSGAFETWIIPRENRSELQALQNHFNTTKWGKGPDPEVVANLLYGVVVAGLSQYKEQVNRGVLYLLSKQHQDGYWKSRWYYGPFYGTYVALRLLKITQTGGPAIEKAMDYLLRNQQADGSWAAASSGESSPLSTALALLCLSTHPLPKYEPAIERARQYLIEAGMNNKGIYPAEPFIIPKGGQAYKSQTMTTAYVLKALTLTHRK